MKIVIIVICYKLSTIYFVILVSLIVKCTAAARKYEANITNVTLVEVIDRVKRAA